SPKSEIRNPRAGRRPNSEPILPQRTQRTQRETAGAEPKSKLGEDRRIWISARFLRFPSAFFAFFAVNLVAAVRHSSFGFLSVFGLRISSLLLQGRLPLGLRRIQDRRGRDGYGVSLVAHAQLSGGHVANQIFEFVQFREPFIRLVQMLDRGVYAGGERGGVLG